MKPTEEREFTYEAILARQNAIFERYEAKQKALAKAAAAKPTAEQKATERWAARPLESVVKANNQSNQRALERTKAEMEEAERKRQQEEYVRRAQIANYQAIELGYAQRQAEALAARRYDPTGNWGAPNYKTHPDD
jgi:hypothetical protein